MDVDHHAEDHTVWRNILSVWPILVPIFTLVILGAQADAKVSEHETRVQKLEQSNMGVTDRLARVETKLDIQTQQLTRIEQKLDTLEAQNK